MVNSIVDKVMGFSKPPKRLKEFLQRKKTLVHGSGPVNRSELRNIMKKIESGQIKTHPLKVHKCR